MSIANIRKDYQLKELLESDVNKNPFQQFNSWWQNAIDSEIDEVNAMSLATVDKNLQPHVRIVLLKNLSEKGFTFFTNYNSNKGKEIEENSKVSILFFWKELERQIRIEGIIEKISDKDSDEYFYSRPIASQIGAIVSPQSSEIENRLWLEQREIDIKKQEKIERPKNWGGYIVMPNYFEFWQGRKSRLHDRIVYLQQENNWITKRLAP